MKPKQLYSIWYSKETNSFTLVPGTAAPTFVDGTPQEKDNVLLRCIVAYSWEEAHNMYDKFVNTYERN